MSHVKKHTFTNAREEIQKTIAAAKYNSRTNGECSSQPSAAGSHQPTGNRKQPPECASDAGGGDDGVDGYDDDDVFHDDDDDDNGDWNEVTAETSQ